MMQNILSKELFFHNGIYFSSITNEVSYPENGNDSCFQIEDSSFWFLHRNRCIVGLVERFSEKKIFLDVGGGNGFVSKGLQDSGQPTILLEPGKSGCINARQRGLKYVVCGTLENSGLIPGSVDAIGAFDVVEHIEDDRAFIRTIYKALKPEGYFYCTVPAYKWLWSHEDVEAGHFRRYRLKHIKSILREEGFEITYASYFFSGLVLPIFIFRSIPTFFGINKKVNELSAKNDHNQKGLVSRIIQVLLNYEFKGILRFRKMRFGSSCILVAKK